MFQLEFPTTPNQGPSQEEALVSFLEPFQGSAWLDNNKLTVMLPDGSMAQPLHLAHRALKPLAAHLEEVRETTLLAGISPDSSLGETLKSFVSRWGWQLPAAA